MTITKRLEQKAKNLTTSQQQLADYIINNMENAAFLSINQLAKETNVSEATVFRFAQALGYEGYQEFVKQLQQEMQDRISAGSLFDLETQTEGESFLTQSTFKRVLQQEINNISALSNVNMDNIYLVIEKLIKAKNIIVVGLMASGSIAHYYASQLSRIFPHVRLITSADIFSASALADVNEHSIVINLAFPRYPVNIENFAKIAKEKKAFCISVTNSHQSPTVAHADCTFIVNRNQDRWLDSFAAPMALLHAILAEFGKKYPAHIRKALKDYDEYVKGFGLFS